jgi:hypothetical protein
MRAALIIACQTDWRPRDSRILPRNCSIVPDDAADQTRPDQNDEFDDGRLAPCRGQAAPAGRACVTAYDEGPVGDRPN